MQPQSHPSIHFPPSSSRNHLRAVARDHVWLNPDLSIDPEDQSMYPVIQGSILTLLSFSHDVLALLPIVHRAQKEHSIPVGHCGAEASTVAPIHWSWCNDSGTVLLVAGCEVWLVRWGWERVELRRRTPAWHKIQDSLIAVSLASEAGCCPSPHQCWGTPHPSHLVFIERMKNTWRSCSLLWCVVNI